MTYATLQHGWVIIFHARTTHEISTRVGLWGWKPFVEWIPSQSHVSDLIHPILKRLIKTNSDPQKTMHLKRQTWWHHQMETFSPYLALWAENSLITGEFPSQRPVTRSFDVFFHLCLNKRWVNNWDTGDLGHHHAHYDVTVMLMVSDVCIFLEKNIMV